MPKVSTLTLAAATFASTMLGRPVPAKAQIDPTSALVGAMLSDDGPQQPKGPNPDLAQANVNSILRDKNSSSAELDLLGHERLLLTDLAPGCQGNPHDQHYNRLSDDITNERVFQKCFSTEFLSKCRSTNKVDADATPQALASLKICMNEHGAKKLDDVNQQIVNEKDSADAKSFGTFCAAAGGVAALGVLGAAGITLALRRRNRKP